MLNVELIQNITDDVSLDFSRHKNSVKLCAVTFSFIPLLPQLFCGITTGIKAEYRTDISDK